MTDARRASSYERVLSAAREQEFAILLEPSANRVYSENAVNMLRAEIGVFDEFLIDGAIGNVRVSTVGAAQCLRFSTEGLTERDLDCLANLSSAYVLFAVHDEMLMPVAGRPLDRYDHDLLSILKYRGKTNEQFTKLLMNVTAATLNSADAYLKRQLRVLDPLCGRGTTLNQAIMYGWDACGIDIDRGDIDTYAAFISRWLKDKRFKHALHESRVRREGKTLGRRFSAQFAESKTAYRAGAVQSLDVITADTLHTADVVSGRAFDLIVTDAPYGIHHGATSSRSGLSRDPSALLEEATTGWATVLRTGGAIGLAWNTRQTTRSQLESILAREGLEVVESEHLHGFRHRVDHAIDRDLIVARKTRH
ncbi:SAM-dependent methyltransferase [Hoyosella sp. YIM 151337]|uniref:TRM11 family SAM-dependent methyltransferase n=1 Tax=Hoyosella sp. YIM 151337 TaxID=2992742 RepID=UPI00223697E5|nr:SAM-dependent methyltransferase [Hoyosella sp. YIM 151337]MCW4353445.1 SAM-dependent methyltransferase [Hoyosella sp. YIM 151337]